MAGVPINFAVPMEQSIISHNWTDIADGQGVVKFYFGVIDNNPPKTLLVPFPPRAKRGLTVVNNEAKYVLGKFNTARTIGGRAYFIIFIYKASGSFSDNTYIQCFKRVNGVDTAISLRQSSKSYSSYNGMITMEVEITPTKFNVGDEFMVKIEPFGGAYSTDDSLNPSEAHIPFQMDL